MTSDTVRGPSPKRRRLIPGGARTVASLASLALLAAVPSAAHAAVWPAGPSFAVPSTAFTNDFVLSPNGASTAAWYEATALGRVTVQHAAPNGTVAAPLDLGDGAAPVLATSASNLTAAAWIETADPDSGDVRLHLTLLDANGFTTRDTVIDTLSSSEAQHASIEVALDDAGNATVAWTLEDDSDDILVRADRVAPDGARVGATTIGSASEADGGVRAGASGAPVVVAAPGGTTWIGWLNADGAVDVWRWPAGVAPDPGPTTVSATGDAASKFSITASSAGAAIAWMVPDGLGAAEIDGARLNASGTLVGAPFTATGALDTSGSGASLPGLPTGPDVAIGPDGVVTLAWTKQGGGVGGGSATVSRFAPGQATAASTALSANSTASAALAPVVDAAADGSILVSWVQVDGTATFTLSLAGARIAPDGTLGAASAITAPSAGGLASLTVPIGTPRADAHGGGIVGVTTLSLSGGGGPGSFSFAFSTYRFDSAGPAITVDMPTSAVVLTPVIFRAAIGEDVPLTWDFGDGSSGRGLNVSHVYAGPGVYTVTARASDAAGNETVVTRQLSITPAQVPDSGRRDPAPPAPAAAAAALKIARAVRSGAKVTVSGTIVRRASGKVEVVYSQRVGGAAITVKKTAKIAKGRWSTTLALPRLLTRGRAARAKGSVTVTFAGSATLTRATVRRTVSVARARRAPRKQQRTAKRR